MKIFIYGDGGREHAIAQTFKRQGHIVYCHSLNAGLCDIAEASKPASNAPEDLISFGKKEGIDLFFIGPEKPLSDGLVDRLEEAGLRAFGPKKEAARLESSKAFSKSLMTRHGVPTALHSTCTDRVHAASRAKQFLEDNGAVVLKPSGLTAGKGVVICHSAEEVEEFLKEVWDKRCYGEAGASIIVEEFLNGPELTIHCFCDGEHMIPLPSSQDHKALLEGGKGPNTGGMGAVAPVPFLSSKQKALIEKEIIERTQMALKMEKITYKGILYFGIMLTKSGPKVLEFNCRFGDPETQAILPLLDSDLAEICFACLESRLTSLDIKWKQGCSCCVVLASSGYPRAFERKKKIQGLEDIQEAFPYHCGTIREDGQVLSNGGRVLCVSAQGESLEDAIARAYSSVERLQFANRVFRKDIGQASLASQN